MARACQTEVSANIAAGDGSIRIMDPSLESHISRKQVRDLTGLTVLMLCSEQAGVRANLIYMQTYLSTWTQGPVLEVAPKTLQHFSLHIVRADLALRVFMTFPSLPC